MVVSQSYEYERRTNARPLWNIQHGGIGMNGVIFFYFLLILHKHGHGPNSAKLCSYCRWCGRVVCLHWRPICLHYITFEDYMYIYTLSCEIRGQCWGIIRLTFGLSFLLKSHIIVSNFIDRGEHEVTLLFRIYFRILKIAAIYIYIYYNRITFRLTDLLFRRTCPKHVLTQLAK